MIDLQKESQVYSDAKSLEEFLDTLLEKWVPSLAYDDSVQTGNEEEGPPPKRLRRGLVEWPEPLTPVLQGAHEPPCTSDLLQLWAVSGNLFCMSSVCFCNEYAISGDKVFL